MVAKAVEKLVYVDEPTAKWSGLGFATFQVKISVEVSSYLKECFLC